MKILTKGDLEDYIAGANILGCGGGGNAESGRAMVRDAFEKGLKFRLADPKELPRDGLLCILGRLGGGVLKEVRDRVAPYFQELKGTTKEEIAWLQKAANGLADFLGEEFCSYIASETGALNGIIPMYMAALEGKPCVDGDCCGRAKPELAISLTNVAQIPTTPLCIVTPFGETLVLKNAVDDYRAEDLCRYTAVASGGRVTVARCAAKVKMYKKAMVPNQVTKCIKIGEAIRIAKRDPVAAFIKEANAEKLFEGTVASHEVEASEGFYWGNWYIKGSGEFDNHSFKVWFKNEHLIGWLDGEPCVVCPDLICIVDARSCHGLSNFVESGEHNGREVIVLGMRAYKAWRTERGMEIFSPKHFGYDIDSDLEERKVKGP